jgi:hypothetical protein
MLSNEIIKPSKSPWNFPIIIVPKRADKTGNLNIEYVLITENLMR